MHHRAIELEGPRDVGLGAEHLDESLRAAHGRKSSLSIWA
jgi:hypothetical protein